ncbi:MAG: type VI secretion system protein TssA [Verrucomicrobiota bacterium]
MNPIVEKLLQPVSAEQPCGPDLSNDIRFAEVERTLKGKPEVEIGSMFKPAEPPDWRDLKAKSAELLADGKHLQLVVIFCCSCLQVDGWAGLRDGLQLLRGLLERYWLDLHPQLDPGDGNSPTWRLNLIGALTADRGTLAPSQQQWLAVLDYIYATPLARARGSEPITLNSVIAAAERPDAKPAAQGDQEAKPALDKSQLDKALRAASGDEIQSNHTAVSEAAEALAGIDHFLTETVGAEKTLSFETLEKALKQIVAALAPYLPGLATTVALPDKPDTQDDPQTQDGPIVLGAVRSRADVLLALENLCEYYQQAEPGSPVPYLLRRAQRLVNMNFVEAIQELNVAPLDALRPSLGSTFDKGTSSEPPAST